MGSWKACCDMRIRWSISPLSLMISVVEVTCPWIVPSVMSGDCACERQKDNKRVRHPEKCAMIAERKRGKWKEEIENGVP